MWLRGVLSSAEINQLAALTEVGPKPGARLSLTKELSRIVGPESLVGSIAKGFGVDACPVRLVAFNKSQDANWSVPWHQDRVISVNTKTDVSGYSNWVAKSGFWHCEAPEQLLSKMIFARIHIDSSTSENGPLELALGSHKHGCISAEDAGAIANGCAMESCRAKAGDVLFVHALTLHRSSSARFPTARRALRVDYAPRASLNSKLRWAVRP